MRRRSSILGPLLLIIFGSMFFGIWPLFGVFYLLSELVEAAIVIAVIVGIVMLIVNLFKKDKSSKTKSISQEELFETFKNISVETDRILIDNDTYLLFTDRNNITLDSIDIFMRDEYIGNLNEFKSAYPNSFNSLAADIENKLGKELKKSKKKNKKKNKVEETITEVVENVTPVEKDCRYYINEFKRLDNEIDNTEVKSAINQTIDYLEDIQKIEDEFGDSKNKTKKLYQYYLPMYVDILENYDRLADNAPNSDEFKQNEAKLMKTSALINSAMETLSGSLVESYYTDLNVNMTTLESILKKDGLVDDLKANQEGK